MRRFYLSPEFLPVPGQSTIDLVGEQARHLAQVLRLGKGEEVEFFDGLGQILTVRLLAVEPGRISTRVVSRRREAVAAHPQLVLVQALLKGNKMDLLVQKANELGVQALLPLVSRFCEKRSSSEAAAARWQRIVIESCKQCQRAVPMQIGSVQPPLLLGETDFSWAGLRLVAWEDERKADLPLNALKENTGPICLLIGPEGGLHTDELSWLQQQDFHAFSLGPRILRAETAAIAAVAIVQYLSGALRPQIC
ncbi:MAG: 16S rRNA (uracil(1498)-N(3))-methyltransferase [Desulfobulbaceae bacterium]|nr:16S rRNA (uracil(1498)-N(3))-methyltransferase [Desulfobulbaceae bacterium]